MATIQIRSRKACQYRRKSNLCSPSAYSAVKGGPDFSEFDEMVVPFSDWVGSITAKYWLEAYTKKRTSKA
jgi:hypothetical protein